MKRRQTLGQPTELQLSSISSSLLLFSLTLLREKKKFWEPKARGRPHSVCWTHWGSSSPLLHLTQGREPGSPAFQGQQQPPPVRAGWDTAGS